jgi:hypothetical protein
MSLSTTLTRRFFLAIIMIMNININKEDAACASH